MPAFIVLGLSAAFVFIPLSIAALAGVQEREAGLASGLFNTSQQIGGALGVALVSTVIARRVSTLLGDGKDPVTALTSAFHWAFAVELVLVLLSLGATLLLVRQQQIARPEQARRASAAIPVMTPLVATENARRTSTAITIPAEWRTPAEE
jgi:MFS family permease